MNDTQDFVNGVDFTVLGSVTPTLLNELVSLGYPKAGKGLVIVTRDTALNQPDVPSPTTEPRWKDYIWIRLPHATSSTSTPAMYAWNDNAVADVDVDKWVLLIADVSSVLSDISNLESAVVSINNQISTINTVLYGSGTAADPGVINKTQTALDTANSAAASVTNKLDTSALDTESTKLFVASAPTTTQSSTRKAVKACMEVDLTNGLQTQINAINAALGVNTSGNYVRIMETTSANSNSPCTTPASVAASYQMKRQLNTISPGTSQLVTISEDSVTVKQGGTYVVLFEGTINVSAVDTGSVSGWQLVLKVNDNPVAVGKSCYHNQVSNKADVRNLSDAASCVISLNTNDVLSLYHYIKRDKNDVINGGVAASCGSPYECFAAITLMKVA